MNNTLIVGKNSRLWNTLKTRISFDYDEVSHKDIQGFLLNQMYEKAIVFSYSNSKNENAELLSALSVYVTNIIYISSVSVEYAELGFYYQYPRVKLFCEQFLLAKKNFISINITRIGLVLETFNYKKITGYYQITNIEKLACYLNECILSGRSEIEFLVSVSYPKSSKLEEYIYALYKPLVKPNLLSFLVTRIFDVLIRSMGFYWYGYSEKKK